MSGTAVAAFSTESSHAKVLPSLDLLRSYAIVSVFTAHTILAYGAPASLAPLQLGGTGVDLFFVLSGWLLGRQLMLELQRTGSIGLTRFWTRRWMRTLPAYYVVLLTTLLQAVLLHRSSDLSWRHLVFAQNYLAHAHAFYVSWSLCVEEHFYLLVGPAVLWLAWLKGWRAPALLGVFVAPAIFRAAGLYITGNETHVRWDECAIGVALAAVSVFLPAIWSAACRYAAPIAAAGLAAYIFNFWARYHPQYGFGDYDKAVYALIFASWVLLANASSWWKEKLTLPGAGYVATRAYAIYLLHPDGLGVVGRLHLQSFPLFFALSLAVTLAAAEVLHRCVELPVMRARELFAFSKSSRAIPHAEAAPVIALGGRPTPAVAPTGWRVQ